MTEPEVAAAHSALADLPAEWLTDGFRATVLRTASLTAAHRKVGAQVAAAQSAVASTVASISSGDVSDATLAALVDHRAALAASLDLQSVVPESSVDLVACKEALGCAWRAAAQCGMAAPLALDYEDELVRWRSARTNTDPPIATDRDRAAQPVLSDAQTQVTNWRQGLATLQQLEPASHDVLGLLAGAQSYIDRAAELVPVVEAANESTQAANAARKEAGLNWVES